MLKKIYNFFKSFVPPSKDELIRKIHKADSSLNLALTEKELHDLFARYKYTIPQLKFNLANFKGGGKN